MVCSQLQAQTSKLEELAPPLAPPPLLYPLSPLVQSLNLTVKECGEVFAVEPATNRPATDVLSGDDDSAVSFWCCS